MYIYCNVINKIYHHHHDHTHARTHAQSPNGNWTLTVSLVDCSLLHIHQLVPGKIYSTDHENHLIPVLTRPFICVLAPASTRAATTSTWPLSAAQCSAVHSFCRQSCGTVTVDHTQSTWTDRWWTLTIRQCEIKHYLGLLQSQTFQIRIIIT